MSVWSGPELDSLFEIRFTGETFRAGQVIVAVGMERMEHVPAEISQLPAELWSHSAAHYEILSKYQGKDVVVIGAGQSGLENGSDFGKKALRSRWRCALRRLHGTKFRRRPIDPCISGYGGREPSWARGFNSGFTTTRRRFFTACRGRRGWRG